MAVYKLKDICLKIGSGATPRGGKEAYCDEGISLIRSQNVLDFTFSHDGLAHINEKQAGKMSNVEVKSQDILLNITGDSVARACAVDVRVLPARVNQHVAIIRPDKNMVLSSYILYFLQMIKPYLLQIAAGGATRNALTKSMIENLEIEVPGILSQKKIVSVLDDIQEKIRDNNEINKNLLQQALAVYKAWFCDYILSDGVFPESWHITTVDALSSLVTRGIAPKYDDSSNQIVLNQKCIRDHTIDVSLARRHLPKKINEKWICKGDLLINSTGTGTLGRVAQVWFDANNMTVDSHVTIVRPKSSILQSYIGFWGFSHESEIEAQHTGSTGQTELPRDRVKAMELPLPDEDTLSKFNELVIPMTDAVVSNQKENARLTQLRDTLLPKLMSGELDVSDIEI